MRLSLLMVLFALCASLSSSTVRIVEETADMPGSPQAHTVMGHVCVAPCDVPQEVLLTVVTATPKDALGIAFSLSQSQFLSLWSKGRASTPAMAKFAPRSSLWDSRRNIAIDNSYARSEPSSSQGPQSYGAVYLPLNLRQR